MSTTTTLVPADRRHLGSIGRSATAIGVDAVIIVAFATTLVAAIVLEARHSHRIRSKTRESINHPATNRCYLTLMLRSAHMLKNGSYSAWFRTRQKEGTGGMQGEGTGVIELNDGKVTGGDTVLAYNGSYVLDGDEFTAFIATQRHTPGQPSVFGIGMIELTLIGKSTPTTASCTGTAKQAPGLTFEATLIRIADQPKALPRAPTRPRSLASVMPDPSQITRDARSRK